MKEGIYLDQLMAHNLKNHSYLVNFPHIDLKYYLCAFQKKIIN
jgi:hypothetical protein